MSIERRGIVAFGLTLAILALSIGRIAAAEGTASVGAKVDPFTLPDIHGKDRSLGDLADKQIVVLAFVGAECPVARLYAPRLEELSQKYAEKGVAFVGIDANSQDSLQDMTGLVTQFKLTFPVLKDRDQTIADKVGAVRTPEVVVLDKDRKIRYRGRIDDQYGAGSSSGYAKTEIKSFDLVNAIEALLAGNEIATTSTQVSGCLIGRTPKAEPTGAVTYSQHIAAIMQANCVECHRPQQIGPFALTEYEEVAGWGPMIKEVVSEGRMPPWFANPEFNKFENDCRLSEDHKKLLFAWVDNGCPQGNPADLPPARKFTEGWQIGEPDVVLSMPEPFKVPAEGVLDYQNFTIDPGWDEGKWVQSAEARPGNRGVVHHIIVSVSSPTARVGSFPGAVPGGTGALIGGLGNRGGAGGGANPGARAVSVPNAGDSFLDALLGNSITIFVPGYTGTVHQPGVAFYVPPKSKINFQLHYTPNGVACEDKSIVGIKFADPATVKKYSSTKASGSPFLQIPPRNDNYRITSRTVLASDRWLLSLSPHMHVRGKSFRYEAAYPDGTREVLLDVPKYDFNWQIDYKFAEPKRLPAGTAIECTAFFDNSENNPANPNPNAQVRFGMQTWEEMMIGFFTTIAVEDDVVAAKSEDGAAATGAESAAPARQNPSRGGARGGARGGGIDLRGLLNRGRGGQ